MDMKSITSLTSLFVSGLLAAQGLPARAQVQNSDAAVSQSEVPAAPPAVPAAVAVDPPPAPPAPPAPPEAPVPVEVDPSPGPPMVTTIQPGQYYGGGSRSGGKLMIIGGSLFGVTYVGTVLGAAIVSDLCQADSSLGCRVASWPIYLPVVGPFIQMAYISGNGANTGRALLGIDGALQAGGLAVFIAGAVLWGRSGAPAQYARRVQFVPYSASTGTGLLAFGRF